MTIIKLFYYIKSDLRNHSKKGIAYSLITFFFNMSFRLILNYRIGHFLSKRRNGIVNLIILFLKKRQLKRYNCDISYHSEIDELIKFPHPISIIIGDKTVVGKNVMIWHEVTLGSHGKNDRKLEYPIIENNVKLYCGCKIIGNIHVGQNSLIGANSVVIRNVPSNSTSVGIPSKLINETSS